MIDRAQETCRTLVIERPAGIGKSVLLDLALALARERGQWMKPAISNHALGDRSPQRLRSTACP